MEVKFSCGDDEISKYLDDGWIIIRRVSQKIISLRNLFLQQNIVIWEQIKDVNLQNQIKLGKRKLTYQKNNFNIMTSETEQLIDLIFKKLKKYRTKKIFLEKKLLKKFIFSLFKQNSNQNEI